MLHGKAWQGYTRDKHLLRNIELFRRRAEFLIPYTLCTVMSSVLIKAKS